MIIEAILLHERFQEAGRLPGRRLRETGIPGLQHGLEPAAEMEQPPDLFLDFVETSSPETTHLGARAASPVAHRHHPHEFPEGEAEVEGAPDEPDAAADVGRVQAVAGGRAVGPGHEAQALVVAHGVGAHPAPSSHLAALQPPLVHPKKLDVGTRSRVKADLVP
jgi:hypothetical protein